MIAVISMYNKEKDGAEVTCAIATMKFDLVKEIEGILASIYEQQPDELIKAIDRMVERLNAKDNSDN